MLILKTITGGLLVAALTLGLVSSPVSAVSPTPIYNAIPSVLPPNVASLGYEATSTVEFGDLIHLGGTLRSPVAVTVTMSDWALYSDYASDSRYESNDVSWTHPITVNVYSAHLGANGAPDTLLASKTENISIPWRPVGDQTCPVAYGVHQWRADDGGCYNGKAFNATFDFSGLVGVTLPNDVIVSVAYNTADYGLVPLHTPGPYNSLNVGVPAGQTVTVGSDADSDAVFWNTSHAPFYTDGGVAGVGILRQDTAWGSNGTMAVKIVAGLPSPTSKDACKNNGWVGFGFSNQGLCIQFANTGKDSRL